MGTQYAGIDTFPIDFTIPDDGDARDASSINVALQALADRTTALKAHSPRMSVLEFLSSGSFIVPERVVAAIVMGCGGGGGGASGSASQTVNDRWVAGGGGGGGAHVSQHVIKDLVPGEALNVDVGDGGAVMATNLSTGNAGGHSIVRRGATALATMPGAAGGRAPIGASAQTGYGHYAPGGSSRAGCPTLSLGGVSLGIVYPTESGPGHWGVPILLAPGTGGYGANGSDLPGSSSGAPSLNNDFAGGAAGTKGVDNGSSRGGGGGGGGGAGPYGAGGAGGGGGDVTGLGSSGFGGSAAAANTGAGGGGGGSAGKWTDTSMSHGAGASGGSGRVVVVLVVDSP